MGAGGLEMTCSAGISVSGGVDQDEVVQHCLMDDDELKEGNVDGCGSLGFWQDEEQEDECILKCTKEMWIQWQFSICHGQACKSVILS